ncbi:MAG: 2Fe-2S iron-sulfur cluster-binding protein [Bacteroidota bacterium]
MNCGGSGICATCGVHIREDKRPSHWHDWLARKFAYPRLSCQIIVEEDLQVTLPKKWIWGRRRPRT